MANIYLTNTMFEGGIIKFNVIVKHGSTIPLPALTRKECFL
jgi:hypothetical protein